MAIYFIFDLLSYSKLRMRYIQQVANIASGALPVNGKKYSYAA